ncbi:MAG TPA: DUF6788 family protein [Crinalium sp.]|jgi:hypothetical protein
MFTAANPEESILPRAELQIDIEKLSLEEIEALHLWLGDLVKERKAEAALKQATLKKGREVLETLKAGKITYQLEKVKCGKKKCKCNKGKLHGPYWYAYSWNGKKLTSTYIGKKLKDRSVNGSQETH